MTFKIKLGQAEDPLVLALDVGSTGTRGGVYDGSGLPLDRHRHKVEHAFSTASDGTSVIDPDLVLAEIIEVIDTVLDGLGERRVAGVAIDTFSSSLIGVAADGTPLTPCYTYADSRCAPQVARLRAELDEAELQQRTGTRLHTSYLPARLRWLRETNPEVCAVVARWLSLSEYVWLKLLGTTAAGTSVAAWTGLLDRRTGGWDTALLEHLAIEPSTLSEVRPPSRPLRPVDDRILTRWPALGEAVWFPGIADGFASNIGTGALDPETVVLAAATSGAMRVLIDHDPDEVPSGLWCYRVDERRSLLGGALNDVGRAVTWMNETLRLPEPEELDALLRAEPQPTTALVLPFFTGERSTGWAGGARAVCTGLSAGHTAGDLYRAVVEGIALSYARLLAQLVEVAGPPQRILASGRVPGAVPALPQILADALDAAVVVVSIKRNTLHGTAVMALEVLNAGGELAQPTSSAPLEPGASTREHYAGRLTEFEKVYRDVIGG